MTLPGSLSWSFHLWGFFNYYMWGIVEEGMNIYMSWHFWFLSDGTLVYGLEAERPAEPDSK